MYPNQPQQPQQPQQPPQQPYQQPQQYSVDYLDQIAGPVQPRTAGPSKLIMIIAALIGLASVVGFVLMLLGSGQSSGEQARDIYLRLGTLQSLSESQQKNLRDNDLRALNSTFTIQLANSVSDMAEPLAINGVDTKKIPKTLTEQEAAYSAELASTFDDAKLNVRLDETYAREMSFQVSKVLTDMQSAYDATNSTSMREFLDSTYKELAPFVESFGNYGAE